MVSGAIGYTYRSSLVHIDGTLNSVRCISGVLCLMTLSFIRGPRNPTFQQDNAGHILPVSYGPSFIRKISCCCADIHNQQISHQLKTSGPWLPNDWPPFVSHHV
ncbi:hypothetical protein TNCV_917701 [Trichonephila clavipes]|nr:hypothetical protein TNCV_917701 [Trichonephila clavipes]